MVSRRRGREEKSRVSTAIWVVAFVFVAGLGYVLGTFNTQIFSALAPIFGIKTYAGSLDLSSVQETYRILKANYDGTLNDSALIEGANRGLVEAVGDEYTVFLNNQQSSDFEDSLTGNIGGGIGIEVGERNGQLTILRILRDNPAEKAGVAAGDTIVSVNDESSEGKTVEEVVAKIRGEVGTTVKLVVSRDGATKEFTITRAEVNNPSVYSSIENGIGLMTITRFDDETGNLARAAAQEFKSAGVRGVILDLRGNGGGYITAAQDVAGLWLDNKVVVSERANDKVIDELKSGSTPLLKDIPTVVLVDGSTASASEIVAGALQDYKVAKLVGEKTFGKGSVQKLFGLPEGAELKVTVARWYTPNGVNISKQGITPDQMVVQDIADVTAGRDLQLDAARALLN